MESILEAKALNKTYTIGKDNHVEVLTNVDMKIAAGEFISVMGPSGSGKSTLLYSISGMDRPTSGDVVFQGESLNDLSEKDLASRRLKDMGFIFQNIHLLGNLGIFDNVILPAYTLKKEKRSSINQRAKKLMKDTGISGLGNNDITQASGGQLQRVAICRALMNRPTILFGDEPTGALNSRFANEIMDILAEINRNNTTILLVTHDVNVASRTERVLYMRDGNIAGEVYLGKLSPGKQDLDRREEKLTRWLKNMGF